MLNQSLNTELKVGIFTVCGLAVVGLMVVTLEGNPFTARKQTFYTLLDNVGGVGPRTQVRTSGVQVGEVSSLEILPKGARVNFKVDGVVEIPKGSFIELRSRGILGDVYLEIVRNENNKETIKPGEMIPKVKEFNDMSALMASMSSIATDIQTVSRTLASVLGNQEGKSSLQNILSNVEQVTSDTRDLIASERKNIARLIEALRSSSEKVSALIERNDGRVDAIMRTVAEATGDLKAFSSELRKIATGPNKGRIENIIASIDDSMSSIRTASNKVQLIVDKVEKGEGSVGQLLSKDDTANDIRAALKNVNELLKPAQKLRFEVDYKGELRTGSSALVGNVGNHFNVRLSTRPDRFYLLGISDSPTSQKVTTTRRTVTAQDGNTQTVSEEERIPEDRERLKLNVQFSKRFEAVGVRFGLFESYAGLAGDLYLFADRVQASVEVFHFGNLKPQATQDAKGFARVKTYSNVFVTPNIYLTGGADNIGKSPKPIAFVGAGLRFTDDDLKAVITAAAIAK